MRATPAPWLPLSAVLLAAPALAAGTSDSAPLNGTVGVCIRWGDDPAHVQEAVVVQPSKNSALNDAAPGHVRTMDWPKPTKDYNGEWVGVNLVFGEATPPLGLPSCKSLNKARADH